jgi:hypothetical protein
VNEKYSLFLLSFSIAEKETKKLDKNMLPRARPTLARIFVGPTRYSK